jgi:hypothetical protein
LPIALFSSAAQPVKKSDQAPMSFGRQTGLKDAACRPTVWEKRRREMILKDNVGVIYGVGGAVGGAVAQAFARERAKPFSHRAPPGIHQSRRQGSRLRWRDVPGWRRSIRPMNEP